MNKESDYFLQSQQISARKQLEFNERNGAFEISQNLKEVYPDLSRYLEGQKLWNNYLRKNEKGNDIALILDFQKNTVFSFNPHNWQQEEELSLKDPLPEEPNGILLVCSSFEKEEKEILETAILFLDEDSPIFIFEEFPKKKNLGRKKLFEEVKKRKSILYGLGLAEAEVLNRPSSVKNDCVNRFFVWRARMPKQWRPREPVNFLEEGPYWRRSWIQGLLRKNRSQYEKDGYRVADDETIKNALRKTTFPLNTLSQTRLGFGYELEAPCGCRWQVGLNGDWTRTYQCEADCEG